MDPDAFTAAAAAAAAGGSLLAKWDGMRGVVAAATAATAAPPPMASFSAVVTGGLEEMLEGYGIRYYTASKIAEMGFTVRTLVDMKEEELDHMMDSLSHFFRWDLLVGERFGIKSAVRAHRRRLLQRPQHDRLHSSSDPTLHHQHPLDALSQEGLSEEQVQQAVEKEVVAGSGETGGATWELCPENPQRMMKKQHRRRASAMMMMSRGKIAGNEEAQERAEEGEEDEEEDEEVEEEEEETETRRRRRRRRQREHPFIVTEAGEVARGKKNGLDYLFHLYEQCRELLVQVQAEARERGDKCPTKVTNQVFRYAKKSGATYINKPKMRHYVHCYALHCLDQPGSDALRKRFKDRGENVGSWRHACYLPLVHLAARSASWDIDALFSSHPRLSIWYVPTKLRQLCHAHRHPPTPIAIPILPDAEHNHDHDPDPDHDQPTNNTLSSY